MSQPFGADYADAYDPLYGDKDYEAECDTIERIFDRYALAPPVRILDLGCGTGSHAISLARRGYHVVGVDKSEEMLWHARMKGAAGGLPPDIRFVAGDIRRFDLEERFDAALMMFAVAGYLRDDAELRAALRSVGGHLVEGGLLMFDFWYGPAVLSQRPGPRSKRVSSGTGTIVRTSSSNLDPEKDLCQVDFILQRFEGDRLAAESHETHLMRFFFSEHLEMILRAEGFTMLRLGAFPDFETDPDESSWNVVCAVRKTGTCKM